MNFVERHMDSSTFAPVEHSSNGVQTGLDTAQLLEILESSALTWREGNRLDGLFLRALCRLGARQPDMARIGFPPWDVAEEIGKLRRTPWSSKVDKTQMAKDVRIQWQKLQELWETKKEGVHQRFADTGCTVVPQLARTEGGGTGNATRYRLEWAAGEPATVVKINESLPAGAIRYICEDSLDAGILARPFVGGWELSGYRMAIFWLLLSLLFLLPLFWIVIFGFDLALTLRTPGALTTSYLLEKLINLGIIAGALWLPFGPIANTGTRRIVRAPVWMTLKHHDLLLERRSPPRFPVKMIMAVRYTARCAHCGGEIEIRSGGLAFWGRLVGRCVDAPAEHVFSFDHILRIGHDLRRRERS